MGWHFCLDIDTGAGQYVRLDIEPALPTNYTHNTNNMLHLALAHTGHVGLDLYTLSGRPAAEVHGVLVDAIAWWKAHRGQVKELESPNCWGDEHGALEFWSTVCDYCGYHPLARCILEG
jgi:hypothetical protein